jgi:hypothetical protein
MIESNNTSSSAILLSARNLILGAALVLVLSVIGSCVAMLRPNDSDGLGRDSFGVTAAGYRALMETLEQLHVPATRSLAPPEADDDDVGQTIVLLRPDPLLLGNAPRFLHALLEWVDRGGRFVVAPTDWDQHWANQYRAQSKDSSTEHDILKLIGVGDRIQLETWTPATACVDASESSTSPSNDNDTNGDNDEENGFWPGNVGDFWIDKLTPPAILPTVSEGSLGPLAGIVHQLAVPGNEFVRLAAKPTDVAGSVSVRDGAETSMLVAALKRGRGEIIVISDPRLLANALLPKGDNSVLAAHLLAPAGESVVFDEFYHGLAVRGDPLYLLTRPGFAAVAVGLLVGVGVWTWRKAVFLGPPLPDVQPARRDIGHYIDAMGDFFGRGPGHRRFLVRETRDGVLQQLCQELKLPTDTTDVDTIATALRRRDPARADLLERAVRQVNTMLAERGDFSKSAYLPTMQQLASCL